MQCQSCGKEITAEEEATPSATNIPFTAPGPHGQAYTHTTPIWLCNDCAAYRRGNIRLVFWIVCSVLVIGAIGFIIDILL